MCGNILFALAERFLGTHHSAHVGNSTCFLENAQGNLRIQHHIVHPIPGGDAVKKTKMLLTLPFSCVVHGKKTVFSLPTSKGFQQGSHVCAGMDRFCSIKMPGSLPGKRACSPDNSKTCHVGVLFRKIRSRWPERHSRCLLMILLSNSFILIPSRYQGHNRSLWIQPLKSG